MPEGPSIVILKEAVRTFKGATVAHVEGNVRKFDPAMLVGKKITAFKSWGKHFLICFPGITVRVHFMLFGSYRINESLDRVPRLHLRFREGGEINFYAAAITLLDKPVNDVYDWTADVMSKQWDGAKAMRKLNQTPGRMVCDALLDQTIFAGVGNIIKNEVLFRTRVHPESLWGKIPAARKRLVIKEAVNYSFDFLKWKKIFQLKKHYQIYTKKRCPRDHTIVFKATLGKTQRRTFYCEECQKLYL